MLAVAATVALFTLAPPTSWADVITTITISNDDSVLYCEITHSCFDPYRTTVTRGETVMWKNPTDTLHAITSGNPDSIKDTFDTGAISPGHSTALELDTPGMHWYFCLIHPWMTGVVHVMGAPITGYDPPLHQYDRGVHPEYTICKEERRLAYRTSDASPLCLKESSLKKFAERGLAIPDEIRYIPDRTEADKERFARLLTDYMGYGDAVTITDHIDYVELYVDKIDYKNEVLGRILEVIHPTPTSHRVNAEQNIPTEPTGVTNDTTNTMYEPFWNSQMFQSAETLRRQTSASDAEYSQINIPIPRVDGPDFVKNDADSIYVIAQNNSVAMVDVGGADRMLTPDIASHIRDSRYLLLHQDVLAVLSYDYDYSTMITLLDVTSGLTILEEINLGAELLNARIIDDTIYVMTSSNIVRPPTPYSEVIETYCGTLGCRSAMAKHILGDDLYKVYLFENSTSSDKLYTITTIPIYNMSQIRSYSFVLGEIDTVYMSRDNIYISNTQEYDGHKTLFADGLFFRHVIDTLEPYELAQLYSIAYDSDIEDVAYFVLSSFGGEDVHGLVSKLEADGIPVLNSLAKKTAIHKIAIDGVNLEYKASGVVEGVLMGPFALNQGKDSMLQVITVTGANGMQSNVYTLDENMDEVGSLEGIAPGETLHSARFSGDWLYAVTFRQVDPFFVIDVSDVKPRVLGVLKIPGYSEYLQNYDDTHVIGIGRDTNQNMFDATGDAGIKISMFDVSDFENPREVQSVIVGDRSTDSAVLVEHESLLIDDNRGILSIPIRFDDELFFYVYSINDDYTMNVHSKIPHAYDESNPYHMRSLYIGDVLYTITPKMIKANDLLQPDVSIGRLEI